MNPLKVLVFLYNIIIDKEPDKKNTPIVYTLIIGCITSTILMNIIIIWKYENMTIVNVVMVMSKEEKAGQGRENQYYITLMELESFKLLLNILIVDCFWPNTHISTACVLPYFVRYKS